MVDYEVNREERLLRRMELYQQRRALGALEKRAG